MPYSLDTATVSELDTAIQNIRTFLTKRGHLMKKVITDREKSFVVLSKVSVVIIELVASGRHARIAERQIRHVKNMMRAVLHSLPYKLPGSLHFKLLTHCCTMTNFTVRANQFTRPTTPAELVLGMLLSMDDIMANAFGRLVMAYDSKHDKDNDKSYEAIVIGFE